MTPQDIAQSLDLTFEPQTPGYLNLCIQSGNQLISSGHVSSLKGKLGADGVFRADQVLAKHDENYMPPEAAEALKNAQAGKGAPMKSNEAMTK